MNLLIETLDVVGKVLVSYTAIAVHYRFRKEHKIDDRVFGSMRVEHTVGLIGIFLIILSYLLKLPAYL